MKPIVRLAAPAIAIALFAGCTPSGQTAFEVNGERIGMSAVDSAAKGCEAVGQGQIQASAIKSQIARMLLVGQLARTVAAENDFEIDGAARSAAITQLEGDDLMTNADCATAISSFGDFSVAQQRLGAEQLQKEISALDVEVNPRFGQWDASKASFTSSTGSLSSQALGNGQVFGG